MLITGLRQYIPYSLIPDGEKTIKRPHGSTTNPSAWMSYDEALSSNASGVGFVFTDTDPYFFVDIDHCFEKPDADSNTIGSWSQLATEICTMFAGCYVEVSQSGTGLHIVGRYSAIPDHRCKDEKLGLELYHTGRFAALTGMSATGHWDIDATAALNTFISRYLPASESVTNLEWSDSPTADSHPILDDEKLIKKACSSTGGVGAIFGGKATFKDLWLKNVDALEESYPDSTGYDESKADMALAQHLAFWTGNDCERIERLMRQSALVRDKWDNHKSYMRRTILGACSRQKVFYNVGAPIELIKPAQVVEAGAAIIRGGYQFIGGTQLMEHFAGCTYVAESHRVLTPNGQMLKSEQFNAMYGGYVFAMDDGNEKTTKKAFEAFTESQAIMFPKVDRSTFRPDITPGAIVEEDGLRHVNTYVPVAVASVPGDVTPFLNHLAKLLPDERDRTILLSYMAACVQFKGVKFKWAPLVQGVEGNGKTLFTLCVMEAVGSRYSHMPPAQEIGEKFNSWLFDKIFIGVEDIYVPEQKIELIETLKPMITGEYLAKRAMQQDQSMHRLCANFMFNSNHKNAVRKTSNDRRFAIFYTAQQESVDIVRDGMGGSYFPDLYDWLKRRGGFAMVTHYLEHYDIPAQYNPATHCQRAPETTSTKEAVSASMGSVELEVMDAIEEGRQGFAGGWVSSKALDQLLKNIRADRTVPLGKRRDMMKQLGYDYHPALKDGRVNNMIMIDGGKPRLYIKNGHIHANLTKVADVEQHYAAAQGDITAQMMTKQM